LQPKQGRKYKGVLLSANIPAHSQLPTAAQGQARSARTPRHTGYMLSDILGRQLASFSSVEEGLPSQTQIWSMLEVQAAA